MSALIRERYRVLEVLGAGGQGEVVHARDQRHGRDVAIKIRNAGAAADLDVLFREVRTLLTIRPHPNLPTVREDFFLEDRYYIVMDWVPGENLRGVLARDGTPGLSGDRVARYLSDAADALDHLHRHEPPVVHGDVKPANLVLTPPGRVVLVDFGLSSTSRGVAPGSGTRGYSAPERASGDPASTSGDVYGLAATAVSLLTGSPPELGVRPDWPEMPQAETRRLALVLNRALALDPARRPATAGRLVSMLFPVRNVDGRVPPNNLPAPATSFVGRSSELAQLRRRLRRTRLLTLKGPPGVGKTRLGLELARRELETWPHGVWFVDLTAVTDPEAIAARVCEAVGLRLQPRQDRLDALAGWLRDRTALLVLDNCDRVIEACAVLVRRLMGSCPTMRVLATSRERLDVSGESVWEVPPLSLPRSTGISAHRLSRFGAIRLFVERARSVKRDFALVGETAENVRRICLRVDALPLGIELAAVALESMPVEMVLAEVEARVGSLAGPSRDEGAIHHTLRDAIDWSYALLSEHDAQVFRHLSVFAGDFGGEAASAVCTLPEPDTRGAIERLARRSLISASETDAGRRYRLLETLRDYASERLEAAGEVGGARKRHREWCLALALRAEPQLFVDDGRAWLSRLDIEHANLAEVFKWVDESYDLLRLGGALWRWWSIRGFWEEGLEALSVAIREANGRAPEVRWKATYAAGSLAQRLSMLDEAERFAEESFEIARGIGDDRMIAGSCGLLAILRFLAGNRDECDRLLHEALERAEGAGDRWVEAQALYNLGVFAQRAQDRESALDYAERALEASRLAGDGRIEAMVLHNLALMAHDTDSSKARDLLERGLEVARRIEDPSSTAWVLSQLAVSACSQADYAAAGELAEEALETHRRTGDLWGAVWDHMTLGAIYSAEDMTGRARVAFEQALTTARRAGDRVGESRALCEIGTLADLEGGHERAGQCFSRAMEISVEIGDMQQRRVILDGLGMHALATGDPDEALRFCLQAVEVAVSTGDRLGISESLRRVSVVLSEQGDHEKAAYLMGAADRLREETGTKPSPASRQRDESVARSARESLGRTRFELAYDEGKQADLDALLVKVLGK